MWKSLMTNSPGGDNRKRQRVRDRLGEVGIDVSTGGSAYWKQLLTHVQSWHTNWDYRKAQIRASDETRKGPWDIGYMKPCNVFDNTIWAVTPEMREANWLPQDAINEMNDQYRNPPPLALAAKFSHGWLQWAASFWRGEMNFL